MTFAIITGAAKRIGLGIATHLAIQGFDIILHYNTSINEASSAVAKIREIGQDIVLCAADLSTMNGINYLYDTCAKYRDSTSLLINNASVFKNDHISSDNLNDSFNEHMYVNLISKISLINSMTKNVSHNKTLDIINLLDYGIAKQPEIFFSYHLTNKILHSATQLIAKQLAPNIRINSIALGQTIKNTQQLQLNFEKAINNTPLKVSSTLSEIYKTIDWILSIKSMTGQMIFLDGGMHLSDQPYQ